MANKHLMCSKHYMAGEWKEHFIEAESRAGGNVLRGEIPDTDTDVALYGVSHAKGWFEAYQGLETELERSDAVVLESEGTDIEAILEGEEPKSDADFRDFPFMQEVGEEALDEPGVAYVFDPNGAAMSGWSNLLYTTIGGYLSIDACKDAVEGHRGDNEYSRREFMTNIGEAAAGGYFLATGDLGTQVRHLMGGIANIVFGEDAEDTGVSTFGTDDKVSINSFDYRNRKIAEGIREVAENQDYDKIVAVHGNAHVKPVAHYIVNGTDDIKNNLYAPIDSIDPEPAKYVEKEGAWVKDGGY